MEGVRYMPCGGDNGCYFEYEQRQGQMRLATGKVFPGEDRNKTVPMGYYYITIRPQECIDKHGR